MAKILRNEDWLAFFTGLAIIAAAWAGMWFPSVKFGWADSSSLAGLFTVVGNLTGIAGMLLIIVLTGVLTFFLRKKKVSGLLLTLLVIFALSLLSQVIAGFKPVKYYGFEYVIFALLLGILVGAFQAEPSQVSSEPEPEILAERTKAPAPRKAPKPAVGAEPISPDKMAPALDTPPQAKAEEVKVKAPKASEPATSKAPKTPKAPKVEPAASDPKVADQSRGEAGDRD